MTARPHLSGDFGNVAAKTVRPRCCMYRSAPSPRCVAGLHRLLGAQKSSWVGCNPGFCSCPSPFNLAAGRGQRLRLRFRALLWGPIVVLGSNHIGMCLMNVSQVQIPCRKHSCPLLSAPCIISLLIEKGCFVQLFQRAFSLILPPLGWWPRAAALCLSRPRWSRLLWCLLGEASAEGVASGCWQA